MLNQRLREMESLSSSPVQAVEKLGERLLKDLYAVNLGVNEFRTKVKLHMQETMSHKESLQQQRQQAFITASTMEQETMGRLKLKVIEQREKEEQVKQKILTELEALHHVNSSTDSGADSPVAGKHSTFGQAPADPYDDLCSHLKSAELQEQLKRQEGVIQMLRQKEELWEYCEVLTQEREHRLLRENRAPLQPGLSTVGTPLPGSPTSNTHSITDTLSPVKPIVDNDVDWDPLYGFCDLDATKHLRELEELDRVHSVLAEECEAAETVRATLAEKVQSQTRETLQG